MYMCAALAGGDGEMWRRPRARVLPPGRCRPRYPAVLPQRPTTRSTASSLSCLTMRNIATDNFSASPSPPASAGTPVRWTDAVWSVVVEYNENTTLHGYRYLTEKGRHWMERLLWAAVHVAAGVWCARYILAVYRDYQHTPTATTVESTTHPIWSVPFPALAVCNVNRISRAAVARLAANMSAATGLEVGRLESLLPLLGRLYEAQPGDPRFADARIHELHAALQAAAKGNTPAAAAGAQPYNVTALMRLLTPKCEQMMVRCSWLGRMRPCRRLFKLRKTCDGYCCIFNYGRTRDQFGKGGVRIRKKPLRVNATGPYMGLTALVDTLTHDYEYPLIATQGVKLLLFKAGEFPDAASGGLVEKLLGARREFFIRLQAQAVVAAPEVRAVSPSKRRCLFDDELRERFGADYSHSDCLVSCRLRSISTLCGCLPFYLPNPGNTSVCNLQDLECLTKYKEKWATPRPPDGVPGLALEREESIECPECLASCADSRYTVRANSAPFAPANGLDSSHPLLAGVKLGNHSIINLYFERADSVLLRQDVLYYWYDLLSNFGGVCGLFVGASLVSSVELVYFATVRLAQALLAGSTASAAEAPPRPRSVVPTDAGRWQQPRRASRALLYWREFKPS